MVNPNVNEKPGNGLCLLSNISFGARLYSKKVNNSYLNFFTVFAEDPEASLGGNRFAHGFLFQIPQRLALKIWSNTPPSLKCVFCAFCQPPKASSTVNRFNLGKSDSYFFKAASDRGR